MKDLLNGKEKVAKINRGGACVFGQYASGIIKAFDSLWLPMNFWKDETDCTSK